MWNKIHYYNVMLTLISQLTHIRCQIILITIFEFNHWECLRQLCSGEFHTTSRQEGLVLVSACFNHQLCICVSIIKTCGAIMNIITTLLLNNHLQFVTDVRDVLILVWSRAVGIKINVRFNGGVEGGVMGEVSSLSIITMRSLSYK